MALTQDLRYALRQLRRAPGFAIAATLMLALGIGANTAMFSVMHAVLFRPLPYPAPDRLVQFNYERKGHVDGASHYGASYRFLRDHLRAFTHVASSMGRGAMPLVEGTQSEPVRALAVAPDYFATLGVMPARGRTFTAQEAEANGPDALILSHRVWQRRFGGDPAILDRAILLGGKPHVVAGIMPESFVSRPNWDVWIPLRPGGHESGTNLRVVARLRDDVTLAQAQREMDNAMPQWFVAMGLPARADLRLRLLPFQSDAGKDLQLPLTILMATVVLVLLIACANLANLLLARAISRRREIAVRASLGANRRRLLSQLAVESLLLATLGGTAGVLLAYWLMPALLAISPIETAFWGPIGLEPRVLAFAAVISLATGFLFGVVPALHATSVDLTESTKDGGRTSSGRGVGLLRRVLIAGELAVSVMLLVGALLLTKTFMNLTAVDPGFEARGLTVATMGMANARYATTETISQFYREGLARIRQIPGVESAAVISNAPMDGGLNVPFISRAAGSDGRIQVTDSRYITPDYFLVMQAPVLRGRGLTDADGPSAPRVAVVNEQFVRRFLRDLDPLGQRMQMAVSPRDGNLALVEIVGVVADMKQQSVAEAVPPTMYVPVTQMSDAGLRTTHQWFETNWVVRTRQEGIGLSEALPRAIRGIDPLQPFSRIQPMTSLIDQSLTAQRFHMRLMGASALLALVLAAAGLFGVISFTVAQRTHEMGVRLALGATTGRLIGAIVGQGMTLAAIGVAIGVAGALALARLLRTFVFGVGVTDPATFVLAAALLLMLAFVATVLPAIRVTRVNPVIVLRRG